METSMIIMAIVKTGCTKWEPWSLPSVRGGGDAGPRHHHAQGKCSPSSFVLSPSCTIIVHSTWILILLFLFLLLNIDIIDTTSVIIISTIVTIIRAWGTSSLMGETPLSVELPEVLVGGQSIYFCHHLHGGHHHHHHVQHHLLKSTSHDGQVRRPGRPARRLPGNLSSLGDQLVTTPGLSSFSRFRPSTSIGISIVMIFSAF